MKENNRKILYVTRDIERALGNSPSPDYIIITNRTQYSETIKKQFPDNVILIDTRNDPRITATESLHTHNVLDTSQLLDSDETRKLLSSKDKVILVFKNNSRIESVAKENGWTLLNPSADLAEKIENKISQLEWLSSLGEKYLPKHSVMPAKSIKWEKEPMIIQWEHGHTGDGTILINTPEELLAIQEKFPNRVARVTKYINGPSFTINVVVHPEGIYQGNISYQITGLPPFTDNAFSTVGNDWSLPHSILAEKELDYIETMVQEIGSQLLHDGWRGLFGIDIIKDAEHNQIFLVEINARQPASTTFESFLQQENRRNGIVGVTIFEAHIAALLGQHLNGSVIQINDGAQVIQRITSKTRSVAEDAVGTLEVSGYRVIPYQNNEHNSDLLRIQCRRGIMESHGKLNSRGKEIVDTLAPDESIKKYPPVA